MDEQATGVLDILGGLLAGLVEAFAWLERTYPGPLWVVLLVASIVGGVWHAINHMRKRRVSIAGTVVGSLGHTDASGATMWRSSASVERTPSYSPFHGRPVILRATPGPLLVVVAWMTLHAPLPLYVVVGALGLWQGYRIAWRLATRRHRREVVEPLAAALSAAYGQPAREIASGLIIPKRFEETGVILTIPLPEKFRERDVTEALAIVGERLGGQWDHLVADRAPFSIGMRRRPPEARGVIEVIRPMAAALGRAQGIGADDILQGLQMRVPQGRRHEYDPDALVMVPLPEHYRPTDADEAARIVRERLGGEWVYEVTPEAPFHLVMRHRPPAPEYITEVVRPMTEALAVALGRPADEILEGVVVPSNWQDQNAIVQIPLPDYHSPMHVTEVTRIVENRLGGDWTGKTSAGAPYVITYRHKPTPPTSVSVQDVAAETLAMIKKGRFILGIGSGKETRGFSFNTDAPHMALSAGSQSGKSTMNRWLVLQFGIQGSDQVLIDPKYVSYAGCEVIPGVRIYNDPMRLDLMWSAIRIVAMETDRRMRIPHGTENFKALYLHLEEQNMFAEMINDWWSLIREDEVAIEELRAENPIIDNVLSRYDHMKKLPEQCPVWRDIKMLLLQAGGFNVHLVSTYQRMSAAAAGGGKNSDGGVLRDQYGVKLLTGFSPSGWLSVVGTRPVPDSPTKKGRWIVAKGSSNKIYQAPLCQPEDIVWMLEYAGIEPLTGASRELSPQRGINPPHEVGAPVGDKGTGDTADALGRGESSADGIVVPLRPRGIRADVGPKVDYYTLKEASSDEGHGIVPMTNEALKKRKLRAEKEGRFFPQGSKHGRATKYTAEQLRDWYEKEVKGRPHSSEEAHNS